MTTVLKLGGELLEGPGALRSVAERIRPLTVRERVVVVHGGGRAIDAALRSRGLAPRFVDGVRITDGSTLETVVDVLAGRTNTAFVAALNAAGVRAVGLTGADAGVGRARRADPIITAAGAVVDLEQVGQPLPGRATLVEDLLNAGYVPVVASIGVTAEGDLLNVNADTFAAHLAAALGADRLVIAGRTAGVLDASGGTIARLTRAEMDSMIASGAAHSGMVAKLAACRAALTRGVAHVAIVGPDGWHDHHERVDGTAVCLGA